MFSRANIITGPFKRALVDDQKIAETDSEIENNANQNVFHSFASLGNYADVVLVEPDKLSQKQAELQYVKKTTK